MATFTDLDQLPIYITIEEVTDLLRVDRGTVYKWGRKYPEFPKPIKLGEGRGFTRYKKSDLVEWLNSHQAD